MRTMTGRVGMVAAVLGFAACATGEARADLVTYAFTARDDGDRILTGEFSYDTAAGPTWFSRGGPGSDPFDPEGWSEFMGQPSFLALSLDGAEFTISEGMFRFPSNPFMELGLGNIQNSLDYFIITSFGNPNFLEPGVPSFDFRFDLRDFDSTAFDTRFSLPSVLDLDDFEVRTASFFLSGLGSFTGVIESLVLPTIGGGAVVPEPSTLAGCLLGAALAGAGCWLGRRRRAA